MVSRTEQLSIS